MIFNKDKLNGKTIWAWICIFLFLGSLIASGAVLKYRVEDVEEKVEEIEVKQDEDHDILIEVRTIVEEINKKIE